MRIDKNTQLIKVTMKAETRLVTVIAGHPFYQSTGNNSNMPGTWLPFNGICEGNAGVNSKGVFVKPTYCFKPSVEMSHILWLKNTPFSLTLCQMVRFGGIDTLCISYLLGSEYWASASGIAVAEKLENDYQHLLVYLRTQLAIKKFDMPQEPIVEMRYNKKRSADFSDINTWLCARTGRKRFMIGGCTTAIIPENSEGLVSYRAIFDTVNENLKKETIFKNSAPSFFVPPQAAQEKMEEEKIDSSNNGCCCS